MTLERSHARDQNASNKAPILGRVQQADESLLMTTITSEVTFTAVRLTVAIPSVRGFQQHYESLVPDLPLDQITALVARHAPWSEMLELIAETAPYGFLIYHRNDEHPVMRAAGNPMDCVAYLMGNHTIAERMFRHDPRAMLYAPLRTLIWEDREKHAWFTVDKPSTQFESLGVPEISLVGQELDRKLATLLEALGLDAPATLRAP
jgi:hypothetical protein